MSAEHSRLPERRLLLLIGVCVCVFREKGFFRRGLNPLSANLHDRENEPRPRPAKPTNSYPL